MKANFIKLKKKTICLNYPICFNSSIIIFLAQGFSMKLIKGSAL